MDPVTVTVTTFCRMVGIGRTSAYALITAKEVETLVVGGRRLITTKSIAALIERELVKARTSDGDR